MSIRKESIEKVEYLLSTSFLLWKQAVIRMLCFTFFKFHFENGNFFFSFLLIVQCKRIFYFMLILTKEFQYFVPVWSFKLENVSAVFVNLIIINCVCMTKKFCFYICACFSEIIFYF